MKIVCIGDSFIFGFGVTSKKRWTRLAAERSGFEIVNLGINGDTSSGVLARLQKALDTENADIYFIMAGCNDIFLSGTDLTARVNIPSAVQHVLARGKLPIIGIPSKISPAFCPEDWGLITDFYAAEKTIDEYRSWLLKYCSAYGIAYVDFSSCLSGEMLLDGLHPNNEGHIILAEKFVDTIAEINGIG